MGTKSIQKQIKSKHPEEYLTVIKGVRCHIERISYTEYYLILIILYILSIYLHLWYIYRLSSTRVYLHSTLLFPDCNDIGYYHDNVTLESTRDYFRSIVAPLPLSWLLWYCVVPQNIHTPPPPTEDHWKFRGGGGVQRQLFLRGRGGSRETTFPEGDEPRTKHWKQRTIDRKHKSIRMLFGNKNRYSWPLRWG